MAGAADETERALHERLLAGDVTAPNEVAERYLEALVARLQRARRDVTDEQAIMTAAIDAVLNYTRRPQQYEPQRGTLQSYLYMAAKGDLGNALRSEARHTKHAFSMDASLSGAVEVALVAGNDSVEDQVLERLETYLPEGLSRAEALQRIAEAFPDPVDRRLLILCVEGERHTAAFAKLLGISTLLELEQRRRVKQSKDRIDKRMKRLRARFMADERRAR